MEKIKIISDSTCDLPKELIEKYDIEVIPLLVGLGEQSFLDGVDIKLPTLLKYMKESEDFPTTAQIIPNRFIEHYKKYLDEGYKVVSIHLSSKMSGTYQSACIAKQTLETEDIVVIDSQNVTSGLGILVLKACRLKEEGLNIYEIEEKILEAIPHVKSTLSFDKLDNLVKGGRLSKAAGVIGNILGIKLILCVKDGEMTVMDKVRGTKKAIRNMLEYIEKTGIKPNEPFCLLEADNDEVKQNLTNVLKEKEIVYYEAQVGCVVGVHSGDGACGVFFIEPY